MWELRIPEHFPQVKVFPALSRLLPVPVRYGHVAAACPVLGAEADALNSSVHSLSCCKATSALHELHLQDHTHNHYCSCTTSPPGSGREQVMCFDSSDLKKKTKINMYSFPSISCLAPLSHFVKVSALTFDYLFKHHQHGFAQTEEIKPAVVDKRGHAFDIDPFQRHPMGISSINFEL